MDEYGKKTAAVTAMTALVWSSAASATNGDQMLGVSATQWGMAGAVVSAPQDAGTVLTNPAGLAALGIDEFRSDMGFGFLNPPRKANGQDSDSNLYLIPAGALAYRASERMTVGMGMAGLSGMGVDFDDINTSVNGSQNVVTTKQFFKIAPGFGLAVNDRLSVGAALNINYQSLALDMGHPDPARQLHLPQEQVYGYGFSVGAIYRASEAVRVGASYISKQEMDAFDWNTSNGNYRLDMDGPQQATIGVAYVPQADWLVEADVKWIGFSEVLDEIDLETPSGAKVPMTFGWDDQIVYAIGVQKRLSPKTTVRFGYNYGESPIDEEDVTSNYGSLAVTEHHFALGLTRELAERLSASLSYVRALNNEISDGDASIELEQNVVNVQISYSN